jgi:hypothetical protein
MRVSFAGRQNNTTVTGKHCRLGGEKQCLTRVDVHIDARGNCDVLSCNIRSAPSQ